MMERAAFSWPIAFPASEISAKRSSARTRTLESQSQQKGVVFSGGRPNREAIGSSAYMEQMSPKLQQNNASFSARMELQWQRKNAAFSVDQKHQIWEKKLENETSRRNKGTNKGFDEESKEFGLMIREKLQEFAMILIKKYHYNFLVEYFDNYHGSFNKEEFLGMEQQEEKLKERANKEARNIDHSMEELEHESEMKERRNQKTVLLGANKKLGDLDMNLATVALQPALQQWRELMPLQNWQLKNEGLLKEEEVEDLVDKQAINHVGKDGKDEVHMAAAEKSLARIKVAADPNSKACRQPRTAYPRQVYNFPMLYVQGVGDIAETEQGHGTNGNRVKVAMEVGMSSFLVLDGGIECNWTAFVGLGCIGLELDKVFSAGVLCQLSLGINLENLQKKKKQPRRRKKERGMTGIEKAGIG